MALPADEMVAGEAAQATRAITIHTPAAQIWPWLLQMGQGRGGLYSYDWLENLVGCDIHTLDTIVPALQDLKVGDPVRIGPQKGLPDYQVVLLEPEKALVLRSVDSNTGTMGETWGSTCWSKAPAGPAWLSATAPLPADSTSRIVTTLEPISFAMEQRMPSGIREHAEKYAPASVLTKEERITRVDKIQSIQREISKTETIHAVTVPRKTE